MEGGEELLGAGGWGRPRPNPRLLPSNHSPLCMEDFDGWSPGGPGQCQVIS